MTPNRPARRAVLCYGAGVAQLSAMVMGVRMVKHHWDGIINAATNAIAESINAKIQRIKRLA